jgi:hypothetical protein
MRWAVRVFGAFNIVGRDRRQLNRRNQSFSGAIATFIAMFVFTPFVAQDGSSVGKRIASLDALRLDHRSARRNRFSNLSYLPPATNVPSIELNSTQFDELPIDSECSAADSVGASAPARIASHLIGEEPNAVPEFYRNLVCHGYAMRRGRGTIG